MIIDDFMSHTAKMIDYTAPAWIKAGLWSSASAIFLKAGQNRYDFPSTMRGVRRGVLLASVNSVVAESLFQIQKGLFPKATSFVKSAAKFSRDNPLDTAMGTALATVAAHHLYKKNSKEAGEIK